jgi:hypothetical protein
MPRLRDGDAFRVMSLEEATLIHGLDEAPGCSLACVLDEVC